MSAHFLFPASLLYEHLPAKSIKKKNKKKKNLISHLCMTPENRPLLMFNTEEQLVLEGLRPGKEEVQE
jgi:hypothetical protein